MPGAVGSIRPSTFCYSGLARISCGAVMLEWRNVRFWAAVCVAPVYWAILYAWLTPDLDPLWPLRTPLPFLLMVLVFPVLEEIVFRGLLQDYAHRLLRRKVRGPVSLANLATSVAFAGAHLVAQSAITALWVFFPSLVFGYFKDRYRSLTAPMTLHVFYNCGFVLLFHVQSR